VSYPQPNFDQYALNGYKFARLNTPLTSDGDIYESQQGAQGFAIGPDSDISKVNLAYFDDQVPRFMNQVAITPERSFPGFFAARNEVNYVPSNRPGRILMWSDELYNNTWSPSFIDVAGRIDFEVPVLDVVQFFAPAAQAMNQGRNDKEYWYDFIPAPANAFGPNTWVLVIPFYGRRFCNLNLKTDETVQLTDIQVSITGLHYKPGTNETAATLMPLLNLDGGAGFPFVKVTPGQTLSAVILASDKSTGSAKWAGNNPTTAVLQVASGMYDALAIQFFSTASDGIKRTAQNTLRIRTSDRENG
jgi:hypothetical protein